LEEPLERAEISYYFDIKSAAEGASPILNIGSNSQAKGQRSGK